MLRSAELDQKQSCGRRMCEEGWHPGGLEGGGVAVRREHRVGGRLGGARAAAQLRRVGLPVLGAESRQLVLRLQLSLHERLKMAAASGNSLADGQWRGGGLLRQRQRDGHAARDVVEAWRRGVRSVALLDLLDIR